MLTSYDKTSHMLAVLKRHHSAQPNIMTLHLQTDNAIQSSQL